VNRIIQEAIDETLKEAGFHKKAGTWYLDGADTILVVNVQKSNYSDQYYVNLAIWVKAFGEARFPKENKCHIRLRLGSLVGNDAVKCFNAEETSFDDVTRYNLIKAVMKEHALPLLKSCGTREGIHRRIAEGAFQKGFVHFQVLETSK